MSFISRWRNRKTTCLTPLDLPPHDRGVYYEKIAAEWLEREQGMTVLETNYTAGHSELDLILKKGDLLIFTEIKARLPDTRYDALHGLSFQKLRGIRNASAAYLRELCRDGIDPEDLTVRYDVLAIEIGDDGIPVGFTLYPDYLEPDHEYFRSAL